MEEDTANIVNNDSETFHAPQRPFRYSQSKKYLLIYSLICLGIGISVIGVGIAQAAILPYFKSRFSYHLETKWMSLSVLFAGMSGLGYLLNQQSLSFLTMTLVTSTLSIPLGLAQCVVHAVNVYFRHKDLLRYKVENNEPMVKLTSKVSTLNVILMLLGLISSVVVILLHRYIMQVIRKNYGYRVRMDKHRIRLTIIGMANIILGLLVTGWWAGIEAFFQGTNMDSHTLPTGEILCHGMIIAVAGYMQLLATSEGSIPIMFGTAALSGCSVIVATYYSSFPISVLHFVLELSGGGGVADMKLVLCILLAFIYIAVMALSIYSFFKFSMLSCCEMLKEIRHDIPNPSRLISVVTFCQPVLGVLYAVIEIMTVALFYAYKIDFSALPMFSIVLGISLFISIRSMHPLHYSATISLATIVASMSTRDMYLFAYHTISNKTADRSNTKSLVGANLAMHVFQLITSIIQFVVAVIIAILILKLMKTMYSIVTIQPPSTVLRRAVDRALLWISFLTFIFGALLIFCGFRMFSVTSSLYVVDFGDRSIFFGGMLVACGTVGVLSQKHTVWQAPSLCLYATIVLLIWQEADRLSYLIHMYSQNLHFSKDLVTAPMESKLTFHETVDFGMSCSVLLLLLAVSIISVLNIFGVGAKLSRARFSFSEPPVYEDDIRQTMEDMIDVSKVAIRENGDETDTFHFS